MKIKEGFVLRKVGKDQVVVAIGEASAAAERVDQTERHRRGAVEQLEQGAGRDELADSLAKKYGISREQAEKDVDAFLEAADGHRLRGGIRAFGHGRKTPARQRDHAGL